VEVATPVADAIGQVFEKINEQISPNLAPIATLIKDWFVDLWEGGFDQEAAEQMAKNLGIPIEDAIKALGGEAGLRPSLKSTISSLATRIGSTLSEDLAKFEAAPAGTPLTRLFAKWAKDLRENFGPEIDKIFGSEFSKKLGEAWEKNKASITQIAADVGDAIGTAITKSLGTAAAKGFEAIYLSFGGLIFNLTEEFTTRLDRLVKAGQGRSTQGISPLSILPPSISPSKIPPPLIPAQQIPSAAGINQGSGGGSIGGGQPINITIHQAASEDSQSMDNRLREMLLDIQRFGSTRGLVAGQANG
jgi:hypothetical protein